MKPVRLLSLAILFLLFPLSAHAQTGTVEGQVTNAETGEPIPGATVVVEGTQTGASADANGHYVISVAPGTYTLRATYLGFADKEADAVEVESGDTTTVNFRLKAAAIGLEEVVVVGYGTQERQDLTGAVSSVSEEAIERSNATQVEEVLQGRVAGVNVTDVNRGAPGAGLKVRIRGAGSINAGTAPLYVIDGVPVTGGLGTISPNDIESIEILKDASATAIYGSRGSNGVVLITDVTHGRICARDRAVSLP